MIHVCFGLYDKTGHYSKFTGTAMLSLFDNTNAEVTVHILHDNTVSAANRNKFIQLAERYNQRVEFYNIEELCADKISEIIKTFPNAKKTRYSIAMFYRLFAWEIFPQEIGKVIYLDSDIVVNLDIKELWQIELGKKPVSVVPESSNGVPVIERFALCQEGIVKVEDYFNSGVLSINLKVFREEKEKIIRGIKFISENPQHNHSDQDILNYCFAARALKLPTKFNRFTTRARGAKEMVEQKIYHYVATQIGFGVGLDMKDIFNRLWMNYFIKTPWFDENSIGRLYEGVQRLHVELKAAMVQLSALMSGKTRAFFVMPEDIEMLKIFFAMRDDEEVILAETQHSLRELIDAMRRSRGKKIFFIIVANFPFNMLTEAGFINGKDFLNGLEFFSEANGMPLNSYELIKAM